MGLVEQLRYMLVIAWVNGWIPLFRIWVWLVSSVVNPLGILLLLFVVGGDRGLSWGLVGGVVWVVASNGISMIGDAAFYRLELKFQQMLVASPVKPYAYSMGLAMSSLIYSLPSLSLFLGMLAYRGMLGLEGAPQTFLALVLLWLSTSSLGFTISTTFRDMRYTWAVANILTVLLSVVPPVYYPATLLPHPALAYIAPTSAAAVVIHDTLGLADYDGPVTMGGWIALAAHMVVGVALMIKVANWRVK